MPAKLDHLALLVKDLEEGIAFYENVVGLGRPIIKVIPELGLRLAFFAEMDGPLLELVEFSAAGELAHGDAVVAIEVDDLDAALAHYRALGVRVFDQPPTENLPVRRGWVMKKHGHGTVLELCPRGEVLRFVRSEAARVAA